jgi:3-hydroxyisobutyrate dehydrogenase-like beta-hydroxyacid dehydrogenase
MDGDNRTRIAFIGFGEAGRAFAGSLKGQGGLAFSAYDILLTGADSGGHGAADAAVRKAAAELDVHLADGPEAAVRDVDWVFSAVTAASSLDAAKSVAGALMPGQVFFDINSVSAGRKQATAEVVRAAGATYVDMAVMAPVHPRGHRAPVLLAGIIGQPVLEQLAALGFDYEHVGDEVGTAATIKMVRSMFVKGMEAVTVQALLAAREAGCFDRVYASLEKSFPKFGWPEFGRYQLERVATHGVRRAAEMRESATTMRELGFAAGGELGDAIAALQDEIGRLGLAVGEGGELPDGLDLVLGGRTSAPPG